MLSSTGAIITNCWPAPEMMCRVQRENIWHSG